MRRGGEDADGVEDARAGTVEELIAVGKEDRGLDGAPFGALGEPVHLGARAGDVEAAGGDDDGVRGFIPKDGLCAGECDELGSPVAGVHERLNPFDDGDAFEGLDPGGDLVELLLDFADEGFGAGQDGAGFADAAHVGPDVFESVGFEGDDARA